MSALRDLHPKVPRYWTDGPGKPFIPRLGL